MMNVDKILKKIDKIPAFPATVRKVWDIMKNPDYSMADLVTVIEYDQAITANILKMCNSAYFGVQRKVSNVRDAVVYLGQSNITRIVTAAGVTRFYRDVEGYRLTAKMLWEHSVAVALMSKILADRVYSREDPMLFTAGLVHDMGKIILGEFVFDSMQEIMNLVANHRYSFLEAEEEIIGINHAEIGGRVASNWNFPKEIIDSITYHHRPDLMKEEDSTNAWILYLADQACMMMGITGGMDELSYRGLGLIMSKFAIGHREFEENIVSLFEDLTNARELINLVDGKKKT
ncbi:MAG TPA: HDOD domain-containing protein [Deltaproteobacteria bacterium]|nr:HDOD domain-containing protein [Deltaproteobacteria bacterium]